MDMALVLGDAPIMEALADIPGNEMHLADGRRPIAPIGDELGEGVHAAGSVIRAQPAAVGQDPGGERVVAGEQGRACRDTKWMGRNRAVEPHGVRRQSVDGGRVGKPRPVAAEEIPAKLSGIKRTMLGRSLDI